VTAVAAAGTAVATGLGAVVGAATGVAGAQAAASNARLARAEQILGSDVTVLVLLCCGASYRAQATE